MSMVFLIFGLNAPVQSLARPAGPTVLCEEWPEGEECAGFPSCNACHTTPPARDDFGQAIEAALWPGDARPASDDEFSEELRGLLPSLAEVDSDGDGVFNRDEWNAGTDPGDVSSKPEEIPIDDPCAEGDCEYDFSFAYRRVSIDICGRSPSWSELQEFRALGEDRRRDVLHEKVDTCLTSAHWWGRDGVLWTMAHAKIRPLINLKSGEGAGEIPLGDYEPDYALFVYAMSGDRDVRDLLLADYYVELTTNNPPRYDVRQELAEQNVPVERRAGMLTLRWFLLINTMFTPLPRTTAAQAYRAFLGLDIAKSEGLIPPESGELIDYDDKGITAPACAACHTTLDPLSYPFSRYQGIRGPQTGAYTETRLNSFGPEEGSRVQDIPKAGVIFGTPVADLREWATVAARSPAFAEKVALDLWITLVGHAPKNAAEESELVALKQALMEEHDYRAERVVHDIVDTFAYGRP